MAIEVKEISVDEIKPNPNQPREKFDKELIEEMAQSIKQMGLLQPIMVRPHGKGYQIVLGERRWRAAQMAKMDKIPAIVRDIDDKILQLYSIAENLHRENLSSIEAEKAIYQLWKKHYEPAGYSMNQMSRELGKNEKFVAQYVSVYLRRKELGVVRDDITTHDIKAVGPIESKLAKKLLKAKAENKIDAQKLEKIAKIVKSAPKEKRKVIVEETIKACEIKEKFDKDFEQEAEEFAKGEESKRIVIEKTADLKRLDDFGSLKQTVSWWGPERFLAIQDLELRRKAVDICADVGAHLTKLASTARKEEWYGKR